MCKKETPPPSSGSNTTTTTKLARKTRSKTRRPKFLSLNSSPDRSPPSSLINDTHQTQLHLFPLHPQDNADDIHEETNVARFFNAEGDGGGASTTLTGLLDAEEYGILDLRQQQQQYVVPSSDREDSRSPTSLSYAYGGVQESEEGGGCGGGADERSLVETAMRRRRRRSEVEEERWVSYWEVVEKKEEEVSSCYADTQYHHHHHLEDRQNRRLSLKLDYEEIMNAWSDKGPLYLVQATTEAAAQTVPDVGDEFLWHDAAPNVRTFFRF